MLKLTRKQIESIIIDGYIKTTVASDANGRVRIAIEAFDGV